MSVESGRENQERLIAELQSIVDSALSGPEGPEVYAQFAHFLAKLRKEYSDVENYRLFHLLVGSGLMDAHEPKFDLPNGEIEKFIRSLKK